MPDRFESLLDPLLDPPPPEPWEDRLPWGDPAFSERMLAAHLDPAHDAATRRPGIVAGHVAWLHDLVGRRPTRVLDLGCGPGAYTARLARLGHRCVGVDVAPAAVRHAREEAAREGLACEYLEGDLREVDPGGGFGLVLVLYGDLDTFPPADAAAVLGAAARALAPGGLLVLEGHTPETVRSLSEPARSWYHSAGGVLAAGPHLVLEERAWCDGVAVVRSWVVAGDRVRRFSVSTAVRDHAGLLEGAGLEVVRRHPPGTAPWVDPSFRVLVGRAG